MNEYADSEMPHGTLRSLPYSIWRRTLARQLSSSSVPGYPRSSSCGIKYSNIVPPHDMSVARPSMFVTRRPRWNQ